MKNKAFGVRQRSVCSKAMVEIIPILTTECFHGFSTVPLVTRSNIFYLQSESKELTTDIRVLLAVKQG